MDNKLFSDFLKSGDSLRIYDGNKLVFSSTKDRLIPVVEYIDKKGCNHHGLIVFDKMTGNAAALLSIKIGCKEVLSPLGSETAVKTLKHYGIKYHLNEVIPVIIQPDGKECPMERLSIGKEPEEFYEALAKMIKGNK